MFEKSRLHQMIIQGLLFLNTFMICSIFRSRAFGSNSLDFQIVLKLGVSMAGFLYAMYFFRLWGARLFKIDGIFFGLYMVWIFATCLYAPSPVYSAAAAFSSVSIICLLYLAAASLDDKRILYSIIVSCTLISFVSIIVYFVNPNFGRDEIWSGGIQVPGKRLSGITSSANAIGYIAAFACLGIIALRLYVVRSLPALMYVFFIINFVAQIMSNSRTSFLAVALAIGCAFMMKLKAERLVMFFGSIVLVILALSVIDLDAFFTSLSRTGNAEEITTGTGRTFIWTQALQMIGERPFFGYGYGSSGYIMPSFEHSSPHAHNMVLQILFTTGLMGMFLVLFTLCAKIYFALRIHDQLKIAFLAFLLLQGITESSAFLGVAGMPTIVLALILAQHYRNSFLKENYQ